MNLGKYKAIVFSMVTGSLLLAVLFLLLSPTPQIVRADPVDLFITPGGGGDCSQAAPCDLQTALSAANNGDSLYLAEGTYTGSGGAVVSPTQSLALYGGWDGLPSSPVIRDAALYPTTLDGEGQRRVVYVNVGTALTIDGFTITGGNASGLGGGLIGGTEAGGGIYSFDAFPVIQNNVISNNVASTQPGVRAFGGGLYISSETAYAVVRNNHIISNSAGIDIQQGDGGGLFTNGSADILSNVFRDNVACVNCSSSSGGGAYIGWTYNAIAIAHNLFEGNQARRGGGLDLVWSAAEVNKNRFIGNSAGLGAGLDSYYDKGSYITANTFVSNTDGSGVRIYITKGPEATRLVNNIIGGGQNAHAALYAYSDWNISAITMTHNTVVGYGTGVSVGQNMTATLINNIIVNHTVGLTVTTPLSGSIYADHTLFWGNAADGIRGTNPVDSDPIFVNPGTNDFHIDAASGAVDSGVDAGVTIDIDGHFRPWQSGYDIGADEYSEQKNVYLPLVVKN